jgi:hypothetical protein
MATAADKAGKGTGGQPTRAAVRVELTLLRWHLERIDAWALEQGGLSRSELVRQLVRERDQAERARQAQPKPPATPPPTPTPEPRR